MSKAYDQTLKGTAEGDPRALLDMIERLPLDAEAEVLPLEREMTRGPLLIDHGFRVRQRGKERIEHIEAYSRFPANAPETIVQYAGEIVSKTDLPVYTTVLLMVEAYKPRRISGRGRLRRGDYTAQHRYRVIRLWEIAAARLLAAGRPYLLSLAPLARTSEAELQAADSRIREIPDETTRGKIGATFHAMGTLRYGKEEWQRCLARGDSMIFDRVLEESPLVQEWKQAGVRQGLEKGREQGLEEGLEQGLEKGREEGLKQGRLQERQKLVAQIVAVQFPSLTPQAKAIHTVTSLRTLDRLVLQLLKAPNVTAARRLLAKALPKQ